MPIIVHQYALDNCDHLDYSDINSLISLFLTFYYVWVLMLIIIVIYNNEIEFVWRHFSLYSNMILKKLQNLDKSVHLFVKKTSSFSWSPCDSYPKGSTRLVPRATRAVSYNLIIWLRRAFPRLFSLVHVIRKDVDSYLYKRRPAAFIRARFCRARFCMQNLALMKAAGPKRPPFI